MGQGGGADQQRQRRGVDLCFRFSHQLLRDAAYNTLLYSQRRLLHMRIAAVLYAAHRKKAGQWASIQYIASHYWRALTDANEVVVKQPEQDQLVAAVDCHLEALAVSLSLDAVEDAEVELSDRVASLVVSSIPSNSAGGSCDSCCVFSLRKS